MQEKTYTINEILEIIKGLQMNNPYNVAYEYEYYSTFRKTLDVMCKVFNYDYKKNSI